jgi:hypothetical protein
MDQTRGIGMTVEDLLELFAHKSFKRLEQKKTHWEIAHISYDGVSIAALCDKDLERLIETYRGVAEDIDITREGNADHEHEFIPSIDGGTLICKCGAWKSAERGNEES